MATSLLPMLLRAVHENYATHDELRFFQVGRVWQRNGADIGEKTHVAGIFFNKKKSVDFYTIKQELTRLFQALHVSASWQKATDTVEPWYLPYQTAHITWQNMHIGYVGAIDPVIIARVAEGDACLFEFDCTVLTQQALASTRYVPVSKYPAVHRDISILIPLRYTADEITKTIQHVHPLIVHVSLTDFFEKPEWQNQRSLTFSYVIQSHEKTLTKQEVDDISARIMHELQSAFSAMIR